MTRERKGQLEKPEDPLKEDLDEEFLKDLHAQGGTGRGRGGSTHGGFGGTKGKVVKVDRKQFEDATTKMAKQSTADAFRRRFASRKAKSRGASGGTGGADSGEDVDSFLEELKLDGETGLFICLIYFILFFTAVISTESPVLRMGADFLSPPCTVYYMYISVCFADGRPNRNRSESCSGARDKQ